MQPQMTIFPDQTNWVHYTLNADGKYGFVIPLTEGQTFIPVQALSKIMQIKVNTDGIHVSWL